MKLIVISSPLELVNEGAILTSILKEEIDYLHIRKPEADLPTIRLLLDSIPLKFLPKIKLHYYRELLQEYPLIGFHHSSKTDFDSLLEVEQSKSFHTFTEIQRNQYPYDYSFLSPVFPSISKQGYSPIYSLHQFQTFLNKHDNQQVIALGGVSEQNCQEFQQLGFRGVALMGELWKERKTDSILKKIVTIKKQLAL